ncbi:MAG TPA: thioesterase family protein [Arenibaculum sp.]|nr:thioesterase family protein [Arenibaculum sp.]
MTTEDPTLHYTVCYADTDAGGVVYHGRYIEMVERARNKLMNVAGFTFSMLEQQYQVMLIVHKTQAVYHAPAVLEDQLQLKSRLTKCRASRSVWVTDVTRDGTLIASVTIEIVALHTATRQLALHPNAFLERLAPYVVPA